MNTFEKASRTALRFPSPKGLLTVEDLWNLPLQAINMDLDGLYKNIKMEIRKAGDVESLITKTSSLSTELQLQLDIVTHITKVKLEAKEKAKKSALTKARNKLIREAIHDKENDFSKVSVTKLRAMLEDE